MANRKRYYSLPDYDSVTDDLDVYTKAWQQMAAPIERNLGLKLNGFDPTFVFLKGNPQTDNVATVNLPVWFVRDLSEALVKKEREYNATLDYTRLL
jgi:hypothetical protein